MGDGIDPGTYTVTVTASDGDAAAEDIFEVTVSAAGSGGQIAVPVGAGADDWEQFGGAASDDFELGFNAGQQQYAGLRFTGIDIPDGATVTSAAIVFTAQETSSGSATFSLGMQDSESAAAFSDGNLPVDGSRDYDSFEWNVADWTAGQSYQTPDLASLVNDVIGTDGVQDGAFAFLIDGQSGSRVADSFETAGGEEPELIISYDVA